MKPSIFTIATDFPAKKLLNALMPTYSVNVQKEEGNSSIILDTFDGDLASDGKILLEEKSSLLFLNLQDATMCRQDGHASLKMLPSILEGAVKEKLQPYGKLRAYLPLTEITFLKETRAILDDELKTVARLHSFVFMKNKKTAHIIVTQPLRGYDKDHEKLIKTLQDIGLESCKESFFPLLGVDEIDYCAKPEICLNGKEEIQHTTSKIIQTFITIARQNEAGIFDDYDTEFLHDYRVSLRKVRSIISLFKDVYAANTTKYLKTEFADIMQVTGRLRDLDVYLLDRDDYYDLVPVSTHQGLDILFSFFAKEREEKHALICKSLQSKKYQKRMKFLTKGFSKNKWALGDKANRPSLSFACKVTLKRYNKVCDIARSIDSNTEDTIVHELRIQCKKLRYLMEFFTPLFETKEIKALIKSLKVLQDNLGRFNDYSVQQESLAEFLSANTVKGADGLKVAESIGALTAMLNIRQQKERNLVMSNFATFDSRETRQLVNRLFSVA
ncbi:MAG: CHAD domain-containing protein [Desulfotalea sp.]